MLACHILESSSREVESQIGREGGRDGRGCGWGMGLNFMKIATGKVLNWVGITILVET